LESKRHCLDLMIFLTEIMMGKIVGDSEDDAAEVISMSFGAAMDIGALHYALNYSVGHNKLNQSGIY